MPKIVHIVKDDCTSCNQCADNLPKYFRMDDDDIAETHNDGENVQNAEVEAEETELVQNEIDECPGECIFWKD